MGALALTTSLSTYYGDTCTSQTTCMLSSSLGINVFNSDNYLYATIFNIDSGTIVFSESFANVPASGTANINDSPYSICALSSTTFVIIYRDSNDYLNAIAGTASGSTITLGSSILVSSISSSVSYSITAMSSSSFVVAYYNNTNTILRAGTVSITTIVLGTAVTGYTGTSDLPYVKSLSSSAFVLVNTDINGNLVFRPATLSTRTITLGTANSQSSLYYPYLYPVIEVLSATSFVVACVGNNGYLGLVVCSTDNSTITVNSFQDIFTETYTSIIGIALFPISSTKIGYVITDRGAGYTIATTVSISGTSASLNSDDTIQLSIGSIPPNNFGLAWTDASVVTSGSEFLVSILENPSQNSLSTYLITYTAPTTGGKKWGGITISKWNGITPSKINSI